jgi:hypothetical protein
VAVEPLPHDRPPRAGQEPVFRAQGHVFTLVLDAHNSAACDLDRCFGFGTFTPAVAANHLFLSFYFLDPLAYVCLSQRYLTPIHAACVARSGRGILLVAGPRSGKSSLAWACARAGLAYVSDDATWLVRDGPEPLLLGKPQRFRFRPDARELIPELAQLPAIETVIGKHSFEIRTAEVAGLSTAAQCRAGKIVFLDRQEQGPAEVSAVEPAEAQRRLALARTLVEPRVWAEQEASVEKLLDCGAVKLRYSRLADAVQQILKLA